MKSSSTIETTLTSVANRYISDPDELRPAGHRTNGWAMSPFYLGLIAFSRATDHTESFETAKNWADAHGWAPGPEVFHGDDKCCTQAYLELYFSSCESARLDRIADQFDEVVLARPRGEKLWDWADGLFMAPAAFAALTKATENDRYLDFMRHRYWAGFENLYDPDWNLIYRDRNYLDITGPTGRPIFWGRANGWVVAGLGRILKHLPESDPLRPRFARTLARLVDRLIQWQQPDGSWSASIVEPGAYPATEVSATGFILYGLVRALREGILRGDRFTSAAERAWEAIETCVHEDGSVGWIQEPGQRPTRQFGPDSAFGYGVGAVLLAGTELLQFERNGRE